MPLFLKTCFKEKINYHLNFMIPRRIITMMANTTAPNSPNRNQPSMNAITEPMLITPQFTFIAIFYHFRSSFYFHIGLS